MEIGKIQVLFFRLWLKRLKNQIYILISIILNMDQEQRTHNLFKAQLEWMTNPMPFSQI